MKQIAELEVREKKTQAQIRLLKREYELVASDVKKVTDLLNTNSLEESIQKLRRIAECGGEWGDSAQEKAWSDIIEEYKCIINTQQAKFIRLEQACRSA